MGQEKCNQSIKVCWSCLHWWFPLVPYKLEIVVIYWKLCFFLFGLGRQDKEKTTLPLKLTSVLITTESNSRCLFFQVIVHCNIWWKVLHFIIFFHFCTRPLLDCLKAVRTCTSFVRANNIQLCSSRPLWVPDLARK